jgi:hypothetical protein
MLRLPWEYTTEEVLFIYYHTSIKREDNYVIWGYGVMTNPVSSYVNRVNIHLKRNQYEKG